MDPSYTMHGQSYYSSTEGRGIMVPETRTSAPGREELVFDFNDGLCETLGYIAVNA